MPPVGVHTQVAEVDFASMYPTIMAIHNISPETVNCGCCLGERARMEQPLPPSPNPSPNTYRGVGGSLRGGRGIVIPQSSLNPSFRRPAIAFAVGAKAWFPEP